MDTLIGILTIVAVIIFKVVGKRVERSAKPQESPQDWSEVLRRHVEQMQGEIVPGQQAVEEEETEEEVKPVVAEPAPVIRAEETLVRKPVGTRTVQKAETPCPKDKIDPKKLIVYSEIMKPKYTED